MPKLVILAACERVIIDRVASLPSLINVFQRMNIRLQDAPLPDNAMSPMRWSIFTLWQHTPEERGIQYTQKLEIFSPIGTKFGDGTATFAVTEADDLQSKNNFDLFGLPINSEGFVKIRVWLEGIADTTGEYQFAIKYLPKESNEPQPITPPS
jgi:hypothetical protein